MTQLNIIFGATEKAQIGVMTLDAALQENHRRSAIVTENEVEDGTTISDHIKLNPETLSLDGIISATPVSLVTSVIGTGISAGIQAAANALGGGVLGNIGGSLVGAGAGSIAGLVTGSPRDPADAFKYLEELFVNRETFEVITALKKYENVVIESLDVPRNVTIGNSLRFTINFKQIRIVKSQLVQIPVFETLAPGASSKADVGKQSSKAASSANEEKGSFLFEKIFG